MAARQAAAVRYSDPVMKIKIVQPGPLMRARTREGAGFSLIELLIVLAVVGVLVGFVVPQLLRAFERSRQRRSMADMRSIAAANATYRVDNGGYASSFADLAPLFMNPVPPADGWGNAWSYNPISSDAYTLSSLGRDGASGPAPPTPWYDEPFDVDIIVTSGAFSQAPDAH